MRRFFAFIVLAIAVLTMSISNISSISENMNQGIEFKGGFEILYQVLDVDGGEFAEKDKASATAAAAEVVSSRIDIAGVKNPQISIEGNDNVRVTIASKNEAETNAIRSLLTSNAEITFRDVNDTLLASASQLLQDNGAILDYQEGSPVVALKIRDTTLWTDITTKISTMSNSSDRRIVIWLGFEDKYDEANSYGFNGDSYASIQSNPDSANKIISDATVSQVFYGDVIIQGSFTDELAAKMANLIKAGTIDFTLDEISVSSIGASYGNSAFTSSLLAGAIGLIAVCILMISLYGLAGVASSVALVLYIVLSLVGFNLLGGEYGPDTIAATVIGIGMAVDANIISFERIKDELYKGRSLRRAFVEGNRKSLSSIIDANLTTLIAALSLYIFGTRTVKGFATMLVVSIFFTIIIMVVFSKLLLSLLCQSEFFQNKKTWFGVSKKHLPNIEKGENQKYFGLFDKFNFMKHSKPYTIGAFSFIGIGLVVMLVMQLVTGSGLNLGLQFSQGTKLYFKTADPTFSTTENVSNFFENTPGINVTPNQIVIGNDETEVSDAILLTFNDELTEMGAKVNENTLQLYTVSVSFKTQLDSDVMTAINTYFGADKEKYLDLYNNGFTLNFVSPIVATKTVTNALYSLVLAVLFIIIYVAWRFKWTYSLGAIIALVHDSLFIIAVFAIFRFEVNIEFVSSILSIIGNSCNNTIVLFDRIRENISESKKPQLVEQERLEIANVSLQQTVLRSGLTTVSTLLPVIALIIFGSNASLNFNIAMFVGLVVGTFSSIYTAPLLWLKLETLRDKMIEKRKLKKANRVKVVSNEPEEYIFYGINDFR